MLLNMDYYKYLRNDQIFIIVYIDDLLVRLQKYKLFFTIVKDYENN